MSKLVLPLAALVFCTWVVSLAGVASLQAQCEPGSNILSVTPGGPLTANTIPCSRAYRFTWFVVILEFVLILALVPAVATSFFLRTRSAWVSLFTIATVLYIYLADAYLTLNDGNDGSSRVKTMVAGTIMTATVNCILLIAIGYHDHEARHVVKEVAHPTHAHPTTSVV